VTSTPDICVLGLGNVLTGDDGVGPHVIRLLEAHWVFPERVSVIDAGTPGLDLTMFIQGLTALIVVDTVKAKGAPGELKLYDKQALLERPPPLVTSQHDPGLRAALMRVEFTGGAPAAVRLVGVIPEGVETGTGLSAAVRAALPSLEAQVIQELGALGAEPTRREPPLDPDIWWERKL
jgi:hydrogenase maturation protease